MRGRKSGFGLGSVFAPRRAWWVMAACIPMMTQAGAAEEGLFFQPGAVPGAYMFDTGVLRGGIREGGASLGLDPLRFVGPGVAVSKPPGILDFYRVFTTNHRYGHSLRSLASESRLLPEGGLEVGWGASPEQPFAVRGNFTWGGVDTVDLEITVVAEQDLPDFELFLASYFTDRFPETFVYVNEGGEKTFRAAGVAQGPWQAYPRDPEAQALIQDGRWAIPPNPVDWNMVSSLAAPLAFRRDEETGTAVVLMAPADSCFGVLTPCADDPHHSIYLSLFGRNLHAGESARARVRFTVRAEVNEEGIVALYEEYLESLTEEEAG